MWTGSKTLNINTGALRQITEELTYACKQIDSRDWWCILLRSSSRASSETLAAKSQQFRRLSSMVLSNGKRYISNGVRNSANEDLDYAKSYVVGLPARIQKGLELFKGLSKQQQSDQVVDMMLTWIIFWASTGGSDIEGGLPDTDLMFGVGNHRNIISHTILLGLGSEIALRLGIEVFGEMHRRLPTQHLRAWDSSYDFLESHRSATINAMWAGIGAHFLKDANLLAGVTKPYSGLPAPMPMDVHQALFAANGAACEAIALTRK